MTSTFAVKITLVVMSTAALGGCAIGSYSGPDEIISDLDEAGIPCVEREDWPAMGYEFTTCIDDTGGLIDIAVYESSRALETSSDVVFEGENLSFCLDKDGEPILLGRNWRVTAYSDYGLTDIQNILGGDITSFGALCREFFE